MGRNQFTFYESFAAAIAHIRNKAARCDAYDAIVNYAIYGKEPDLGSLPEAAAIAFSLMRPVADSGRRKAENRTKRKQTGTNEEQNGTNEEQTDKSAEQTDKEKENEKEKEREYEREYEREIENECSLSPYPLSQNKKSAVFQKPTLDEVTAYCQERGNNVDPQQFLDHYSSNGWRVGKNPMKDWKAAIRTWEKNEYRSGGVYRAQETTSFADIYRDLKQQEAADDDPF